MVSLSLATKPFLSRVQLKPSEYCRIKELPRLLKLWPTEVEDYSYPGTLKIAALLRKALRAERCRARGNHWAYDLSRHIALIAALRHERARLRMLERTLPSRKDAAIPAKPRLAGTLRLPCPEKLPAPVFSCGS